jgi:hypothetical protein
VVETQLHAARRAADPEIKRCVEKSNNPLTFGRGRGGYFFLLVMSAIMATTAVNDVARKMPNCISIFIASYARFTGCDSPQKIV